MAKSVESIAWTYSEAELLLEQSIMKMDEQQQRERAQASIRSGDQLPLQSMDRLTLGWVRLPANSGQLS
ncbi:hypothetical protein ANCDUO_11963 [Ancylostoma duodenale]|uniref:Uncharacterized protein n=1 Tax=Ancylostoma duodenale TaxID=51022 RepID=A0A0C2D6U9_9BILA|nr:hypothetical protein ANCDUO_11963 [Ancylostoma duodenale]